MNVFDSYVGMFQSTTPNNHHNRAADVNGQNRSDLNNAGNNNIARTAYKFAAMFDRVFHKN